MSNHSGSYMLNDVLRTHKNMGLTSDMSMGEKRLLAKKMFSIGIDYDCNRGEIIEDIGKEFGICSYCYEDTNNFKGDYCVPCHNDHYGEDDE